jgi:hypothetical protein
MSSRLAGKGACACLCAGFQHPASAVASEAPGRRQAAPPREVGGAKMQLKWWQWGLFGFGALTAVGLLADLSEAPNPPSSKARSPSPSQPPTATEIRLIAGDSTFGMVFVPQVAPEEVEAFARSQCQSRSHCQVLGWTDQGAVPRPLPMNEAAASALAFDYVVNRTTGYERVLWDCRRWRRPEPSACLSGRP